MSMIKKFISAAVAVIMAVMLVLPVFAAQPEMSISSAECALGEKMKVTISMKNAVDFTSGDINVQYNPNILRFVGAEECASMTADSGITMMYSEPTAKGEKDEYGKPIHAFYLTLLHLEKFPQSLNNCDVITLEFEAVGVGECPLVLSASSFFVNDEDTTPLLASGKAKVTGEGAAAPDWDFGANADPDNMYTDPSYTFAAEATVKKTDPVTGAATAIQTTAAETTAPVKTKSSTAAKVGIAAAVVVVVAAVVAVAVISGKKKNIVDE